MHYAEYREKQFFVGSGVVVAGCRTVISERLQQSGMRWSVGGANAIIALRCCILGPLAPRSPHFYLVHPAVRDIEVKADPSDGSRAGSASASLSSDPGSGAFPGGLGAQALDDHVEPRRGQRSIFQHIHRQFVEVLRGLPFPSFPAGAEAGVGHPKAVGPESRQWEVEPRSKSQGLLCNA